MVHASCQCDIVICFQKVYDSFCRKHDTAELSDDVTIAGRQTNKQQQGKIHCANQPLDNRRP